MNLHLINMDNRSRETNNRKCIFTKQRKSGWISTAGPPKTKVWVSASYSYKMSLTLRVRSSKRCLAQDQELQPWLNALNSLPPHLAFSWDMLHNVTKTQSLSSAHEAIAGPQSHGAMLVIMIIFSTIITINYNKATMLTASPVPSAA